jgi:DNA-binding beta-propeller fold protein YncE
MRRLVALCLAAGCGGGWPDVVDVRDVPTAGGAPDVETVRDLGYIELPEGGSLPRPDSDGTFVVGELILIEGDDFGKLPTILVGGRPAGVIARTGGGGIVTRVPDGVPSGKVSVEVSHPRGKSARDIEVKRYGLVAQSDADKIYVLDIGKRDANVLPQSLTVQNPRLIRFIPDGSLAYVASGVAHGAEGTPGAKGKLSVIAMTAAGGPKVVGEIAVGASRFVVGLAVAERAPLLAVVGESELQLFSLRDPPHPAPYDPFPLPGEIVKAGVVTADIEPYGEILALLVGEGNQITSVDVADPEKPRVVTSVDILPGERLPLVRDMRFSADGETLWVASGDNAASLKAGKQPTRITAITLKRPEAKDGERKPIVAVWRTSTITGASAPLRLTVSRGQPMASGTTIRTPPDKAAVFMTTIDPQMFQLAALDLFQAEGREKAVACLKPIAEPGMLARTNLEGGGGPLFSVGSVLSALDVSPDSQVLVATTSVFHTESNRLTLEFGVTVTPLWGAVKPRYVKLAEMQPDAFKPPFSIGHVRIQP